MNSVEIQIAAKGSIHVNQLVQLKRCFGRHASLGCVVPTETEWSRTINCRTVSDLIAIGWASEDFRRLDDHIHNLETVYEEVARHKLVQEHLV